MLGSKHVNFPGTEIGGHKHLIYDTELWEYVLNLHTVPRGKGSIDYLGSILAEEN